MASSSNATVYMIRHGVALHNVFHSMPQNDQSFHDAALVPEGQMQARQMAQLFAALLRKKIDGHDKQYAHNDDIIIVSSPLTRCLQTAECVYNAIFAEFGKHPVFLCEEELRELCTSRQSNHRQTKSHLKQNWPGVQFSPVMAEEDLMWSPAQHETWRNLASRIHSFCNNTFSSLINTYTEKWQNNHDGRRSISHPIVILVTHGLWMECCMSMYSPQTLREGRDRVYNCNVFKAKYDIDSSRIDSGVRCIIK